VSPSVAAVQGFASRRVDLPSLPVEPSFARLTSPVLVGREEELASLLGAVLDPPAVALVEGEAGVGKTRLVQELTSRTELNDRYRCLSGHSHHLSEPFPLGPVVEALREAIPTPGGLNPVVGALRPLLPELAARLPAHPGPLGDRRAERHRLFRAVRELLDSLGPTVLVLEDLHWADHTTEELLSFLVPQLPRRLALVCTYRREDLSESSPLPRLATPSSGTAGLRLTLRPLDRGEVRELARTILENGDISPEFSDYLFECSGGLPFAVEEVLRLLEGRDELVQRRGVRVRQSFEELGVPTALRESILQRLANLEPNARSVVQAAAVLGGPAAERDLLEVADVPDTRAGGALSGALASALLLEVDEGRYDFRHALARQAVEEAIPSPVRRRLHLRAARALESGQPKPVARLAHHYRRAGKTKEWIRFAEAAADRAKSLEDDATAYRFLKEAVAVPGLPPATRARLAVKLATHARYSLAHGEAIDVLRALLEDETLSRGARGEVRLWLARLLIQEGETAAAHSETSRALGDLGRRPALAAEAMVFLALPWATEGRVDDQLGWLDRAVATAARSKDRAVRISVTADRAALLLNVGDPRGWPAIDEIPEPGPGADELRQAVRGLGNLADALLQLGHYGRAEEFIRRGLDLLGRTGHSHEAFSQQITELQLSWAMGRWDGLEERARYYMEAWHDWAAVRADAQTVLGLLLLARGDVPGALRLLEQLAEDFRGEGPVLAWIAGGLARIRLAEGREEAAVEEAARALDVVRRKSTWVWASDAAPVAVEALVRSDRRVEAQELTRRFATGLKGRDAPAASAALAVCRALLAEAAGDRKRAVRTFLAAEAAWQALPRPYEAARARESAGRCLLEEGGQELLVEALSAFRELGATWDEARVRRTLREQGVIVPYRGGRKGYGSKLSPRETQVARLAADGLSNPQIAAALYLSRKTVERHLSSAMHKVGVRSRGELAGGLGPRATETAP
jgi:DNA-binding CsgD family transcriptional regulator